MNLQNVTIRAVSNTVAGVTTIIAVVDHPGPPSRTFYHGIQQPDNATPGVIASVERQAIVRAVEQFLLWVQNGKPTG
jgi:hypothetical protein